MVAMICQLVNVFLSPSGQKLLMQLNKLHLYTKKTPAPIGSWYWKQVTDMGFFLQECLSVDHTCIVFTLVAPHTWSAEGFQVCMHNTELSTHLKSFKSTKLQMEEPYHIKSKTYILQMEVAYYKQGNVLVRRYLLPHYGTQQSSMEMSSDTKLH